MRRPPASLALALAALAFACLLALGMASRGTGSSAPQAQFVRVMEVAPWAVEPGDRVSVFGDGFPADQPAHLSFRGTLYRSGESATHDAQIGVIARVMGPTRLEFALDDVTEALFCGSGDRATHTTFEGGVEVAFAPANAGAPPSVGQLGNVTLDVRPRSNGATRDRQHQGERLLAWLGIDAAANPLGLLVQGVAAGSRAQAAGIAPGEVISRFDGVLVESAADVVPPPAERAATIDLQDESSQPGSAHRRTRTIPVDGFRPPLEADFATSLLSLLTALGVVCLFSAPPLPGVAAALQRVVSYLRASRYAAPGARSLAGDAFAVAARQALPPWGPAAIADTTAYSLLMLLSFPNCAISVRLDVWILFVMAVGCLAAAAFVVHPSVWRGLAVAGEVAWRHMPAAAGVASAVLLSGSLRLREIADAQGGSPNEWLVVRSPISLLSLGLLVASGRVEPGSEVTRSSLANALEDTSGAGERNLGRWFEAACRAHRIFVAGLASVLFLGGWRLPGVSAARQWGDLSLEFLGALLLLAKTLCLVLVMAWTRWLLPRRSAGRAAASISLGVTLFAVAATQAWIWWAPPPSVQRFVSMSLTIALAVTGIALAHRLRHGLVSAEGDAHLSTFL